MKSYSTPPPLRGISPSSGSQSGKREITLLSIPNSCDIYRLLPDFSQKNNGPRRKDKRSRQRRYPDAHSGNL